jgi:hypothetical protein
LDTARFFFLSGFRAINVLRDFFRDGNDYLAANLVRNTWYKAKELQREDLLSCSKGNGRHFFRCPKLKFAILEEIRTSVSHVFVAIVNIGQGMIQ